MQRTSSTDLIIDDAYFHETKISQRRGVCDCPHAAHRVPFRPLRDEPLGGTHNSAAVQGKDKTLEFPNTDPYAVTVRHSCDISTDQKQHQTFTSDNLKLLEQRTAGEPWWPTGFKAQTMNCNVYSLSPAGDFRCMPFSLLSRV